MELKIVENEIHNANWSDQDKQLAISLLPRCGEKGLVFLNLQAQDLDSNLISSVLLKSCQNIIDAVDQAKNGGVGLLMELLEKSPDSAEYDFGRYVLPFVLDFKKGNGKIPKSLELAIDHFELLLFKELPLAELKDIVKYKLLFFAKRLNLVMEFQRICYNRDINFSDGESRFFLLSFENNNEELGTAAFVLDGKNAKPTIKNWIHDFTVSVRQAAEGINTFNEVRYLERSPNILALSKQDQQLLKNIFKLYDWFVSPVVNYLEVKSYEAYLEHLADNEQSGKTMAYFVTDEQFMGAEKVASPLPQVESEPLKKAAVPIAPKKTPPPVPQAPKKPQAHIELPKLAPLPVIKRTEAKVDIDQKLSDLKKKIK